MEEFYPLFPGANYTIDWNETQTNTLEPGKVQKSLESPDQFKETIVLFK